jgi:hypothetical protein
MFHGYGYVSLLVSHFDVPVSLGGLLQGKALVYDRSNLTRLNKLCDSDQVFSTSWCNRTNCFLAPS